MCSFTSQTQSLFTVICSKCPLISYTFSIPQKNVFSFILAESECNRKKEIAESKKKLFTVKKCRLTEKEHSSVSCKKSLTVNGRVLLVRIVRCMWNYKSIIGKFQCFKHQQKKCFQGFLSSVLQAQQLFTVHKSDLSRVLCDCKLCCTFCLLTNCRCLWYVNGNSTP